jgi:hypothetical protein
MSQRLDEAKKQPVDRRGAPGDAVGKRSLERLRGGDQPQGFYPASTHGLPGLAGLFENDLSRGNRNFGDQRGIAHGVGDERQAATLSPAVKRSARSG